MYGRLFFFRVVGILRFWIFNFLGGLQLNVLSFRIYYIYNDFLVVVDFLKKKGFFLKVIFVFIVLLCG